MLAMGFFTSTLVGPIVASAAQINEHTTMIMNYCVGKKNGSSICIKSVCCRHMV